MLGAFVNLFWRILSVKFSTRLTWIYISCKWNKSLSTQKSDKDSQVFCTVFTSLWFSLKFYLFSVFLFLLSLHFLFSFSFTFFVFSSPSLFYFSDDFVVFFNFYAPSVFLRLHHYFIFLFCFYYPLIFLFSLPTLLGFVFSTPSLFSPFTIPSLLLVFTWFLFIQFTSLCYNFTGLSLLLGFTICSFFFSFWIY